MATAAGVALAWMAIISAKVVNLIMFVCSKVTEFVGLGV